VSTPPDVAEAAANLSQSLAQLAKTAAGYVGARVEQADHALARDARRRMWMVLAAMALLLWLATATLFTGVAIIIAFWDTHRVIAAVSVAAGFFVLAGAAAGVLYLQWRRRSSTSQWLVRALALFGEYRRLTR
jgi:uncharacterized membrane protein YqjE